MRFVVITGSPAAGKATVGKALAERFGFKLFHNHVSLDMVTTIFDWGSPSFGRLVKEIRERVIEEAAENDVDLIFTYVWAFNGPDDGAPIRRYREIVLAHGAEVFFVELVADLETRMARNGLESRRRMKQRSAEASTPEWIAEVEEKYSFDSGGRLPFDEPQLRIDTSKTDPAESASMIAAAFGFQAKTNPATSPHSGSRLPP